METSAAVGGNCSAFKAKEVGSLSSVPRLDVREHLSDDRIHAALGECFQTVPFVDETCAANTLLYSPLVDFPTVQLFRSLPNHIANLNSADQVARPIFVDNCSRQSAVLL